MASVQKVSFSSDTNLLQKVVNKPGENLATNSQEFY